MGSYSVGDLHCNLFTLFISQHILHSLLLDIVLKFLNMSADSSFWYLVLICEN